MSSRFVPTNDAIPSPTRPSKSIGTVNAAASDLFELS
jgi:hypothetical protein